MDGNDGGNEHPLIQYDSETTKTPDVDDNVMISQEQKGTCSFKRVSMLQCMLYFELHIERSVLENYRQSSYTMHDRLHGANAMSNYLYWLPLSLHRCQYEPKQVPPANIVFLTCIYIHCEP
jgi:hypothetical protein